MKFKAIAVKTFEGHLETELDLLKSAELIKGQNVEPKESNGLGKHQLQMARIAALEEKLALGLFEPKTNN